MWQNWINALLGLWIILVSFLGMTGSTLMWTLVITGIVIAALALWSVYDASMMMGSSKEMTHQYQ